MFQFLEPGPLCDGDLSLVEPHSTLVEAFLASALHPQSLLRAGGAAPVTRGQVMRFVRTFPRGQQQASPPRNIAPTYNFWMQLDPASHPPVSIAGTISLRIGTGDELELYYGHIGYAVFPPARGHHDAERACRLLFPLAKRHGLTELWITCNPDNLPSRRTCERLGGTMAGIVPLPAGHPLYEAGDREKCRYRYGL